MKLSEFKQTQQNEEKKDTQKDNYEKKAEDLYDKYKDMSQGDLMNELMAQVANQKSNGTFNYNQLENSVQQVLPFLNEEQKNNLLTILQKLK